jgi:A118 family predicted phage portal protein
MKFDDNDISLPQTPFGTSLIYDIMSYLMTYDLAWSYYVRDLYLGKGSILIPKPLTNPSDVGFVGVFAGLDKSVYELLPSLDPDKMTPTPIQFNLRTAEWIQTQDNILKKIATTIGMSPKTIAGYLDDAQGQKTATEIDAEDDATIAFIEIKRGIYERALNKLVELVTNHYGFSDNIEIRFATPSLVNQDKVIERAIRLMESGLADEEEALQMIYPDDDERQLQERVAKMKAKKQELEQKQQMMNPYGIG